MCNPCPKPVCNILIAGAGSTLQAPFDQQIISAYLQLFPAPPSFSYNAPGYSTGSSAGMTQLLANLTNFAGTDVPPTPVQDAQAASMQNVLLNFPIAVAGVSIVFGSAVKAALGVSTLDLTANQLSGIYQGTITDWHTIIPAIPIGTPITVVARSDGSGDTADFTNFLFAAATSPTWPANLTGNGPFTFPAPVVVTAAGNAGIVTAINSNPYSIGYLAYGFAVTNSLPFAAILNSSGNYILPSVPSISAAVVGIPVPQNLRLNTINTSAPNGYPISNPTNIVVFGNQPTQCLAENLRKLLFFFSSQAGQAFAELNNLGELSPAIIAQFQQNLSLIKSIGC